MFVAWVSAGLSPDDFWQQTPASFGAVIDGVKKRLQSETEGKLAMAHTSATFAALASAGKLKPMQYYMPVKPMTAQEMLATLRSVAIREGSNGS